MTIPTLPTAPARTMSQDTFDAAVEAWIAALDTWTTAVNALGITTITGSIQSTPIGNVTPSTGAFTTLYFGESQSRLMSSKFAANTIGYNLFIGGGGQAVVYDGANNYTGSYNTASGTQSLYSNTTGYYNTASGTQALYANTTGSYNTASG